MKFLLIIACLLFSSLAFSQYYLRGELKDDQGQGLASAQILLSSKPNYPYYTGNSGAFGIPVSTKTDTITFILDGYDTLKTPVVTTVYGNFTLKISPARTTARNLHLSSITKNLRPDAGEATTEDGESYSSTIENPFVDTKTYPETGFALHVNRASYSNIRRFLKLKKKPPADAVRIEEMINYFNLKTKPINNGQKTFTFNTTLTSCPWNSQNQLLFINLQARKINLDKTPSANLVFLIDVSGSMDEDNRLPLIKSAFKLLVENLRSQDVVSIVTYGDEVTVLLDPTHGDNKQQILDAIEGLTPSGATAGASAIRTAYRVARNNFIKNGNNRIILATDGDFNIGQTSDKDLEDIISRESKSGIYLTCLGVGIGNYKDSKLEALANKGNGNFAYLDNEKEAEKVLVEEFAQTLYSVADNVRLNIRFNSDVVKEYRLIGFDNKKSAIADTATNLEGGEIGSGHSLLAAFEVNPTIHEKILNEHSLIGTAELSYTAPLENVTIKEKFGIPQKFVAFEKADSSLQFATAVIMFGTFLKQSSLSRQFVWNDIYSLASDISDRKNRLQMEFVDLVAKAKKMYPQEKRRKRSQ